MTADRWQQLKVILEAVEDCTGPARDAELDRLCNGDARLRAEAESLLAGEDRIAIFERDARRPATPDTPWLIGPYRVERLIGAGGMGAVYLAERADEQYRKRVAIKVIQACDERLLARFRSERQILASLEHPYIARLLDGGVLADSRPYFVMEYVEGRPIDSWVAQTNASVETILDLFLRVCSAVQFAHRNLIVHRDLKAGNILVTDSGQPRLLDFGIARVLADSEARLEMTQPFERVLTPAAASPEQILGRPVTTASDVYSLGVLLYTLLTGTSPYAGANEFATDPARVITSFDVPPPSAVPGLAPARARVLAGDLDNIVRKALEKEPARRYGTADELAADIRNYLEHRPVVARPASLAYRASRFVRRNRLAVSAAALIAVAVVGGTGASLWYARRANIEKARAERRSEALRRLSESLLFELHDSIAKLPGATEARALVARRAAQYLDQLASDADRDPAVLADLASAYYRVAVIQATGRGPHLGGASAARDALESHEKALAIRRRLFDAHPGDTAAQRDLLDSMWAVAGARAIEGDLDGALRMHRQRLGFVEDLLAKRPSTALRYSVAASLNALGDLQRTAGNFRQALDYNRRALAIREQLLQADPGSPRARRLVGISHEGVGYTLDAMADYSAAAREHQQALGLFRPLAASDRANSDLQRLVFVAENNACETLAEARAAAQGMEYCNASVADAEAMHKADIADAQAVEDLGAAYSTMSVALSAAGRDREALSWEQRADQLFRASLDRDPDSIEAAAASIDHLLNLAAIERRLKLPHSCEHAQQGMALLQGAIDRAPRDAMLQGRLPRARELGAACAVLSRPAS
jgi:tRNA A-37 threonylcarbamoyl transferase component Bud32/tetratricopeptide (TPR) repeat protein